jgi:hypothetical protein
MCYWNYRVGACVLTLRNILTREEGEMQEGKWGKCHEFVGQAGDGAQLLLWGRVWKLLLIFS